MKNALAASHLDMRAFARSSDQMDGCDPLARYGRIALECQGRGLDSMVVWSARGEIRADQLGQEQFWLHLHADATAPLTCQRCLEVVNIRLLVDRSFRFVADEEAARAQDDEAQEDLLVLAGDFNLQELVEDELVLELPFIARHDVCPVQAPHAAVDADFDASASGRPNPFAALAQLKAGDDRSKK